MWCFAPQSLKTIPQCLLPPELTGLWLVVNGPTYKITWPFDHMVLQDHVAN